MALPRTAFTLWTVVLVAVASAASCVVMADLRLPGARYLSSAAESASGVVDKAVGIAGKVAEAAVGVGETIRDHASEASELRIGEEIASKAKKAAEKVADAGSMVASKVVGEVVGGLLEVLQLNDTCLGESRERCKEVMRDLVREYLGDGELPGSPTELWEALKKRITVHPGTKWCGAGNVARSLEDSGVLKATDACCRDHDGCPDNIAAGQQRHGLNNSGSFTRSNCECDRQFYKCLKEADTLVASKIGVIYFDILRPNCFEETYPTRGCKQKAKSLIPHCNEYEFDYNGEKLYQWFDNPLY